MKRREKKKRKKINKSTILFIILDILAIGGFVMMYGPWDKIRNFYVNTAMKTKVVVTNAEVIPFIASTVAV